MRLTNKLRVMFFLILVVILFYLSFQVEGLQTGPGGDPTAYPTGRPTPTNVSPTFTPPSIPQPDSDYNCYLSIVVK